MSDSEKKGTTDKRYTAKYIDERRSQVIQLAKLGCTDKEIGGVIEIGEDTIKRRMREELDEGRSHMRASLRKAQLKAAVEERNPTMLIWLGKCYLAQREPKKEVEHSGAVTVEKVMFGGEDKIVQLGTG